MAANTTQIASFEEALTYRHPGVVRRYAKEQQTSLQEAEEVFRETLKWLYLCACGLRADIGCASAQGMKRGERAEHS